VGVFSSWATVSFCGCFAGIRSTIGVCRPTPYGQHAPTDRFLTGDHDISAFNSQFPGAGLWLAPPGGLFGTGHRQSVELRYGHYVRGTGMVANSLTFPAKLE